MPVTHESDPLTKVRSGLARVYTIDDIQDAWAEYKGQTVLQVLNDGQWETKPNTEIGNIKGTSAKIVKVSVVMSFPKFLEENYG